MSNSQVTALADRMIEQATGGEFTTLADYRAYLDARHLRRRRAHRHIMEALRTSREQGDDKERLKAANEKSENREDSA